MLSRVADSVFWMARYVERAENVARFIDVNHNLTLDLGEDLGDQWAPLVNTTGDHEAFVRRYDQATRDNVLHFLTFDTENPNSILSCLSHARENARTAREIISSDMWEELNRFYLLVSDAVRAGGKSDYDFFARIKRASHLLIGTTDATMSHGEAWHFARMGRLLERAEQELGRLRSELDFTSIADIIHTGLHEFIDEVQLRLNSTGEAIYTTFCAADASAERLRYQEQLQ